MQHTHIHTHTRTPEFLRELSHPSLTVQRCRRHVSPSPHHSGRCASSSVYALQALVLEKIGELGIRDIEINEPFTSKDVRIGILRAAAPQRRSAYASYRSLDFFFVCSFPSPPPCMQCVQFGIVVDAPTLT